MSEQWRANRLGAPGINGPESQSRGMLSMADDNKNDVPVVNPASASGLAKWLEIAKKVGIGLGILIGTILTVAASGGLTLPPGLIVALNAILALLAAAGLASPGLKPLSIPSQKGPPSDP